MSNVSLEKLIEYELEGIPKDKLQEIYDLIHYFKVGIEKENTEDSKFLKFASDKKFAEVWKEEKDGIWESYL